MQIKAYLDEILNKTAANPFLESQSISFEERPPDAAYITGIITFIDGSKLHFKEFVIFGSDAVKVVKYGYNYLSSLNDPIFRYDNALDPAARSLATYPCHKHTAGGLQPANKPAFENVLLEISNSIKHNQ